MRFARENLVVAGKRLALPGLYGVLWWLLAATIAGLLAAIAWGLVTPVSPLGAWRPRAVKVLPAPARAALFAALDPFNRQARGQGQPGQAQAVTALALTLFGTRAAPGGGTDSTGGGGSAIIAGPDGVQQVYRVGEDVQPGVKLVAVAFDSVTLDHNGTHEMLYIDQSKAAPDAQAVVAANPAGAPPPAAGDAGGPLTVDAAKQGIAFAPHAQGGDVNGLEVQSSGDGKAFRAAGFQPGDVVVAIGGKPVSSAADAAALAGQIRPGASISVTVKRGDRQLPLAITLAQ